MTTETIMGHAAERVVEILRRDGHEATTSAADEHATVLGMVVLTTGANPGSVECALWEAAQTPESMRAAEAEAERIARQMEDYDVE